MDTQELRDISGIGDISYWPPGPGWYALITLCLLAVLFIVFYKRARARHHITVVLKEIDVNHASRVQRAAVVAENIRRLMLARYPRTETAAIFGYAWLKKVENCDPRHHGWSRYAAWLPDAPYRSEDNDGADIPEDELIAAERACADLAAGFKIQV